MKCLFLISLTITTVFISSCSYLEPKRSPTSTKELTNEDVTVALKSLPGDIIKSRFLSHKNLFTPIQPEAMKKLSNDVAPIWVEQNKDIEQYRKYMEFFRKAVAKLTGNELKQILIANKELFLPFKGHGSSSGDELIVHAFDMQRTAKALGIKENCFSYINLKMPSNYTGPAGVSTYSYRVGYNNAYGALEPNGYIELSRINSTSLVASFISTTNNEIADVYFSTDPSDQSITGNFRNILNKNFDKLEVTISGKPVANSQEIRTKSDDDWRQLNWKNCLE